MGFKGLFKSIRAKNAREEENPVVKGRVWSKLNGGTSTTADAIMDSGCTYPISTKTVTDAMKVEIKPLEKELTVIESYGRSLEILGTLTMYMESEALGGRKIIEAAVIEEEGSKEILISLGLMKKRWIHCKNSNRF